jgi:hypothetical protein
MRYFAILLVVFLQACDGGWTGSEFDEAAAADLQAGSAAGRAPAQIDSDGSFQAKSQIPNHFWGRWTDKISKCATRYDDASVQIYEDAVKFWESEGEVTAISHIGNMTLVTLSMFGEGERWSSEVKLERSDNPMKIRVNGAEKEKCR